MSPLSTVLGQKFARVATNMVVRAPGLWRLFRRPIGGQFDRLAERWDTIISPEHLDGFDRALEAIEPPPMRALDLGTGTGVGAFAIARRFPDAEVVGVDLAKKMVEQARAKIPGELRDRVRFEQGDASRLPYEDGSFDLVALANMIPFFDELARLVAPDGYVLFSFSGGPETPIYVPDERLRAELERRGFADFAAFAEGRATALLARRRES